MFQKGDIVAVMGKLGGEPVCNEVGYALSEQLGLTGSHFRTYVEVMLISTGQRILYDERSIRKATDGDIAHVRDHGPRI